MASEMIRRKAVGVVLIEVAVTQVLEYEDMWGSKDLRSREFWGAMRSLIVTADLLQLDDVSQRIGAARGALLDGGKSVAVIVEELRGYR